MKKVCRYILIMLWMVPTNLMHGMLVTTARKAAVRQPSRVQRVGGSAANWYGLQQQQIQRFAHGGQATSGRETRKGEGGFGSWFRDWFGHPETTSAQDEEVNRSEYRRGLYLHLGIRTPQVDEYEYQLWKKHGKNFDVVAYIRDKSFRSANPKFDEVEYQQWKENGKKFDLTQDEKDRESYVLQKNLRGEGNSKFNEAEYQRWKKNGKRFDAESYYSGRPHGFRERVSMPQGLNVYTERINFLRLLELPTNTTDKDMLVQFRKISRENHPDMVNSLINWGDISKKEGERRMAYYTNVVSAYNNYRLAKKAQKKVTME